MIKYLLFIAIISTLWHMSLSTAECNAQIIGAEIIFLCPSSVSSQELNFYDYTTELLDNITSIVTKPLNPKVTTGPFTSLPPNICLLRNLQSIDFSTNQINIVDPTGSLQNCLTNVNTLILQSNLITEFPSYMIYNMPNLKNIDFSYNQLTDIPLNGFNNLSLIDTINFSNNLLTSFELWAVEVISRADFSNNKISSITNKYFFDKFLNDTNTNIPTVLLTGNNPTINFTDVIYEMYNQCEEVQTWYFNLGTPQSEPLFTRKLAQINFGTTQINCSCDQLYYLTILADSYGEISGLPINTPIRTATCTNSNPFFNYSCSAVDTDSTADFSAAYPRLCKILKNEDGEITPIVNISAPTFNSSVLYPHYETAFLNPGACFFIFINETSMDLHCTNDTSDSSQIPSNILTSSYLSKITSITFLSPISSFPSYLCSLPSHEIDLSHQAFTSLTDATFPCLDSFTKVILSYNQITSVNMSSGNFQNLTYLDLSSNYLTTLPYSILRPTPSSLRYLDLRNNSIHSVDLFLYTLKNITVYLDENPINSTNIINPENVTLVDGNSTVNITYPSTVTNSSVLLQDSTVAFFVACASFSSIRSFLLNLRSASTNTLLICTCASFRLKELYQTNNLSITNDFNCSVSIDTSSFQTLTSTNCSNSTQFPTQLCSVTTTTIPTNITTINTLNNSIEFTSTSFTMIMKNSSNETNSTATTMMTSESSSSSTTTSLSSVQSSNGGSSSNHTGLIVGLVVGLVGFFLLLAVIIVVILFIKSKSAAAAGKKKPINRAKIVSQTNGDTLQSRVQPRNLRAVKLAPITAPTSDLPKVPVSTFVPTKAPSLLTSPNSTLPTSAKGIPIRLDPIKSPSDITPQYPPNSNALNNSSSFRPINNRSTYQIPIPQQQYQAPKPQKPRSNLLNAGGDTRY